MQRKKEYYCWVRAVPSAMPQDPTLFSNAAPPGGPEDPESALSMARLNHLVQKVRTTCPEIKHLEMPMKKLPPKDPPPPPGSGPLIMTTRKVLGMQQMATVHLEHAARRVFPLEMDMMPIFGDKNDAVMWIEGDEGAAFCEGAQGVTLVCFAIFDEV